MYKLPQAENSFGTKGLESIGKPDAWKLARPVWGWGQGVILALHHATCEPCPMCLSAIHFAGIKKLYYGANRHHAAVGGFDDIRIYQLIDGVANSDIRRISKLPLLHPTVIEQEECAALFGEWNAKADRTMY